jgi:hypothetical protein
MLGMYIHMHWGYRHPYAARTWTLSDWEGYLEGLSALGYDFIMIWPLLDSMPPVPTADDRAFLLKIARAIDLAHDHFGMRVVVIVCPNTIGNEVSADYAFADRPYFTCEKKVDPKDPSAVEALLAGRRNQLAPLRAADGLAIIDSDPGGFIGSTNDEFVHLMQGQIEVFRELNPSAELIYWMLFGWENYNRFWAQAQSWQEGDPPPRVDCRPEVFADTLERICARTPEPWSLFACFPEHAGVVAEMGLEGKAIAFSYGLVEGEPTFPLTNLDVGRLEATFRGEVIQGARLGRMANAQTHCLQLPHTYLFARLAQGGTAAGANLAAFAHRLLPGMGEVVARGWQAIGGGDPQEQRVAAQALRQEAGRPHASGELSGLLFGDADRFLIDLAMNLELRAALAELDMAIEAGKGMQAGPRRPVGQNVPQALRGVLDQLRPYQQRIGFVDAYGGPLAETLNRPLARLHDPRIDPVLEQFHDWRDPSIRNGLLLRLLAALEDLCRHHGA